jgi:DNA-directed RNA polymerase specialized sigma24 family protein
MPNVKDLDLLAKSLSGDWKSRIELFKKFVWDSPHVRKLGVQYHGIEDFLHDCFTNVLRSGHAYDGEQDFADWVETVAAWTALERQRVRPDGPGVTGRVRLSAGIEGDEPGDRARLASYVPPRSGAADTLPSRIAAVVGEPQFTLLRKRTLEGSTWDDLAGATGKPLTTIGPLMVRAVERLARFFGAPPPLNDDLEPVFSWVVQDDAKSSHANPAKPKGRILPMQLDPAFYTVTPDMRKIGLGMPNEVRTLALWDAARATTPPGDALREHLAKCNYCADLLRALLLMDRALKSGPDTDFLLCPGGFSLLRTSDEAYAALDQHLDQCAVCREERARFLGAGEEGTEQVDVVSAKPGSGLRWNHKLVWAAAAVALLAGGGYLIQRHYSVPATEEAAPLNASEPLPIPTTTVTKRYSDLAQPVSLDDKKMLASVLSRDMFTFNEALAKFKRHQVTDALLTVAPIADRDPGAQMLHAIGQYQLQETTAGYREMLKAEAMSPRNSFRCWATLQCALIAGDQKVIDQEIEHLLLDPEYAARARELEVRVKARG